MADPTGADTSMLDELRAIYEQHLERATRLGRVEAPIASDEHRSHPRFRLSGTRAQVKQVLPVEIVDMSLSGLSLHSQHSYEPATNLDITFQDAFTVSVRVQCCEMEQIDSPFMECRYRVNCEFEDPDESILMVNVMLEICQSGN